MTTGATRNIGSSGLRASSIGFGCFNIAGAYGGIDEAEAVAAVHAALDSGVTLFDTADFYGGYTNEALLARALGPRISEVIVSTKAGVLLNADGSLSFDGRPATIKASCDASLKRLGVEAIDLYLLARVDKTVPIEETVGAFSDLVSEGKVRNIGLCEVSSTTVRRAHAVHRLAAVQNSYSLLDRSPEVDLLATVRELGIGIVAYSPLGRGLLSGSVRAGDRFQASDFRAYVPMFASDNLTTNVNHADKLARVAQRLSMHPATLALAWLLAKDPDVIPIPGTRKAANVKINASASEVTLPRNIVEELDELFPQGVASGDRYPEFLMAAIG